MKNQTPKNTICLWFNKDALDAAWFYAATFPDGASKLAACGLWVVRRDSHLFWAGVHGFWGG